MNNKNNANIVIPEKKNYIWLIVGISIGVLIILSVVLILIFKFALKKKNSNNIGNQNESTKKNIKGPKVIITSKETFV